MVTYAQLFKVQQLVLVRQPNSRWDNEKGRIQEILPPYCAKVFLIHKKFYVMVRLDQLEEA